MSPALRIDAHQHFWRYAPHEYAWIDDSLLPLRRDFGPPELEAELVRAGFDGCVAVQARQTLGENEALLALAERHAFVRGVVGWVDLQAPAVRDQLRRFAAHPRFVGVRHVVQGEPDERFLLRPEVLRGIGALREFDLTYDLLIHARQLPVATEFVERCPEQAFVLDHLAKPPIRTRELSVWAADLHRLAQHPNVCAKLSGLVTEADWKGWTPADLRPCVEAAFECFGADRLMIGSDWPVCTVAGTYERVMGVVLEALAGRPQAEREAVLGGNAVRFYGLDRHRVA